MEIGKIQLRYTRFPDAAGKHQDDGATAALIRELGDNYEKYHEYLTQEGKRLRDEFDPKTFGWDLEGFGTAAARLHEIGLAESLLRVCRGARKEGKSLGVSTQGTVQLLDGRERLLSVETGKPAADDPGVEPRHLWRPANVRPGADG